MHLKEEIRRSSLPEESALLELGRECFPSRLAALAATEARVDDWIAAHPLRSRLIATELTNRFVDSMGSTALLRLTRETGRPAWEVARAWFAARDITDSRMLQQHISAAENDVAADVIRDGHLVVAAALERCVLWILANCDPSWSSSEIIDWLGEPLRELRVALPDILPREQLADLEARQSAHESAGLPGELARQIAATDSLDQLLPASRLARDTAMSAPVAGAVYFRVSEQIDYRWLREQLSRLAGTDMWAQRAAKTMRLELEHAVTAMSCGVLDRLGQAVGGDPELVKGDDIERALEEYLKQHEPRLARIHHALQEVRAMDVPTLPALMVIVHTIRSSGDVGSEGA